MPRGKVFRTVMGMEALRPVRSPALARFFHLPIPCVLSTHNTTPVYLRGAQSPVVARSYKVRIQALRLLSM